MVDRISKISPVSPVSPVTGVTDPVPASSIQGRERSVPNSDAFDPLNGANIDKWNLSFADKLKIQFARIQFGLSYQVMNAMNTLQETQSSPQNLFSSANYEFLQNIISQFQSSSQTLPPGSSDTTGETADVPATATQNAEDALKHLKEYFSPENTAKRILDVATSFFGLRASAATEGDTEASRQTFSDFIGGAIDEGFRQARKHLWQLPLDIQNGVDQTHELITDGLTRFVQGVTGSDQADSSSNMSKIATFHQEAVQIFSQVRSIFVPGDYDSLGKVQAISMATFNKTG